MIDRTTFDLRIAQHGTTTASVERHEWKRQGHAGHAALRTLLAGVLVSLATRLAPEQWAGEPRGRAGQGQPAGA